MKNKFYRTQVYHIQCINSYITTTYGISGGEEVEYVKSVVATKWKS